MMFNVVVVAERKRIMSKKMKIAMITNHFGITGISTVILNYCKALDHDKFDLSVIAGKPIAEENKKECEQNGIKLIVLPSRHQQSAKHYIGLWKILKRNKYDIVHVHGNSSMMAIELTIAKMASARVRIAHSHNSACPNMKIHKILNPYFRTVYKKALACGVLAGDWLYGQNQFDVLPNGFHTERFLFDKKERERTRKELHIENKLVIGHIGRFNEQKNQSYLLRVFGKVVEKKKDSVLLLVGTGPDFEKIKDLVDAHPYKSQIILYGVTKNTQAMYSAMDIFMLPSRHEGLPVVLLEAQISGLPCIVSDKVTKEMDFGNICWESIDAAPEIWAKRILDIGVTEEAGRQEYYRDHKEQIREYDIENTVKQLERIYMELREKR